MKKWILALILTFSLGSLQAQLDFGLRAGVGLAKAGISDFNSAQQAIEDIEDAERELSYHAGIYFKIKTPVLFIQPEVIFSQVSQSVNAQQSGTTAERSLELDMSRVDIPLLIGKQFGPLRLMAGPVYSANISDLSGNIDSDLKSGTFGYQLGLGFEIKKLLIDVRYEGAFSPWASNLIVDQTEYQVDLRTSQILVCLGFELF
tara:strand:- start:952 stop:1560 length:609 start_codon:yes stop_codon:yes gene_type:complete